jgi:hypothetical protein
MQMGPRSADATPMRPLPERPEYGDLAALALVVSRALVPQPRAAEPTLVVAPTVDENAAVDIPALYRELRDLALGDD